MELRRFIERYARAWDDYDLDWILDFYLTPSYVVKRGRIHWHTTEEEKRAYYHALLTRYGTESYERSEIPDLEIKELGEDGAFVTVHWVGRRVDGTVAFDLRDAYHLVRVDGEWRIIGDVVFDEAA